MIRKARIDDVRTAAGLAMELWPDNDYDELLADFESITQADDRALFIDFQDEEGIALAICQLRRDYVEGTDSSPVGYLEGIYVRPEYRNQGRARALVRECEFWAKGIGCSEFASDCPITNEISLQFHLRVGFIEANRIICFTKQLH